MHPTRHRVWRAALAVLVAFSILAGALVSPPPAAAIADVTVFGKEFQNALSYCNEPSAKQNYARLAFVQNVYGRFRYTIWVNKVGTTEATAESVITAPDGSFSGGAISGYKTAGSTKYVVEHNNSQNIGYRTNIYDLGLTVTTGAGVTGSHDIVYSVEKYNGSTWAATTYGNSGLGLEYGDGRVDYTACTNATDQKWGPLVSDDPAGIVIESGAGRTAVNFVLADVAYGDDPLGAILFCRLPAQSRQAAGFEVSLNFRGDYVVETSFLPGAGMTLGSISLANSDGALFEDPNLSHYTYGGTSHTDLYNRSPGFAGEMWHDLHALTPSAAGTAYYRVRVYRRDANGLFYSQTFLDYAFTVTDCTAPSTMAVELSAPITVSKGQAGKPPLCVNQSTIQSVGYTAKVWQAPAFGWDHLVITEQFQTSPKKVLVVGGQQALAWSNPLPWTGSGTSHDTIPANGTGGTVTARAGIFHYVVPAGATPNNPGRYWKLDEARTNATGTIC